MTLPSSGPIGFNNISVEIGNASTAPLDFAWIYNNTKAGQQAYNLANYYGKAWYQRNVDGNCNNGNCNCGNCNCACDFNCTNCYGFQCVNCTNCDARAWLQNNCNCACTYNCNLGQYPYNCNCACDCVCCFPGDTPVTMADGTQKRIDEIRVGDVVDGGNGFKNRVLMYHRTKPNGSAVYIVNGRHRTTKEHKHLTTVGWAAIDPQSSSKPTQLYMTVDNDGRKEWHSNRKCTRTTTHKLEVGMVLKTIDGEELVESIELDHSFDQDEFVYTLCTDGSHTHIASGNLIVGAWVRDYDFDYDTWTPIEGGHS